MPIWERQGIENKNKKSNISFDDLHRCNMEAEDDRELERYEKYKRKAKSHEVNSVMQFAKAASKADEKILTLGEQANVLGRVVLGKYHNVRHKHWSKKASKTESYLRFRNLL